MARNWTCTLCNVGWATENSVPDRCPVCSSRGFEEVIPAPVGRQLLVWGGLDFDTEGMDVELREALAHVAPEDGALRGLPVAASLASTLVALRADCGGVAEGGPASNHLKLCLERLQEARALLVEADGALRRARRSLGLVS